MRRFPLSWDFAEYGPAVYVFDELTKRVAARDLVRNVAPRKHLRVDDFFLGYPVSCRRVAKVLRIPAVVAGFDVSRH